MPSRSVPGSTGPDLTLRQLNRSTLLRQSLLDRSRWPVAEAVGRLAGLQAQYANSPYIALWTRLRDFAIADLEAALTDRSVVKATLIRSTLHLVAAEDYAAFDSAASGGRIANWRPTAERAGVDIADIHRRLLGFASEPKTVAQMEVFVEGALSGTKIADHAPSGVRRVAYRVASAPGRLIHVPPSGMWGSHGKPSYIDAAVWLPGSMPPPDRADALVLLAERYLRAYGPASQADFSKWAGLAGVTAARGAIAVLGDRVRTSVGPDGRDLLDLVEAPQATGDEPAPPRFLARWDSVVIGYAMRDRILPVELVPTVVKKNGDFLPSFTVDGFIAGTWGVQASRGAAVLTISPAVTVPRPAKTELTAEAERLVRFVAADASRREVRWA